ncbi:RHS repeat-associated core domain-containing protein [Streptomyces sp. JB150]|uniref:RHS repeat-associated core domain-containing protein n=1 Tax=Streptomyces sp. JB150 TaxID=2714844 RepID=UPI00140CD210|nr:RHS repeat-associated core domain-containing protein [Streptomyces sp. JB150]QIJ63460.1 RHS repeat protein [Streptomyces sp. JB150]
MGYTLPDWLDEILDFIGINFPNVDEDDYREMARAMRDFADKFEKHGGETHKAATAMLSSSEGWAVDAIEKHWGKVKSGHLDKVPELARLFADACDVVADIIFGMKRKAEIELGAMAASVGISLGLAAFTGGLSALLGAAEIAAMRQLVKKIVDEAADRVVEELIARVTEPVNAKLEAMVEDAVLDLAEGAFTMPPAGSGGDGAGGDGHGRGHDGMQLASAGGGTGGDAPGGGAGKKTRIDHVSFEDGSRKISLHGGDLNLNSSAGLTRARTAFGRTKGKDPFTQAFESILHGALDGTEKALKKISKHVTETVPERVKAASRLEKNKDLDVRDRLNAIAGGKKDGDAGGGHARPAGGAGRRVPESLRTALDNVRQRAIALAQRRCKSDPVDVASGEMVLSQTDLVLPGVLPLVLRRTHISGYRFGHCFGASWASTLDERLELTGGGAIWAREDGSLLQYPRLPLEEGDEVLPLEGERIPLTYVERSALGDVTYATSDVRSGLTRRFTGSPYSSGSLYWLTDMEDRNGNGLRIARDDEGIPTAVLHDGGYRVRVTSDPELGRVTALEVRTPDGPVRVASFGYDGPGRDLVAVSGSRGVPLRFTYDDAHRVTSWTDRNGHTYGYVYDVAGRVVETIGPDGALSSRFTYDRAARETRFTDSTGAVTVTRLNELGQTISETDPLGNTVHFAWDRYDNLLSRTDELGHTARFTYDDAGNLLTVRYPDGRQASTTYNELHLPETVTGPDGTVWRNVFDERGNRTAVVAPDGTSTTFTHDATGALATVTFPTGETETRVNDEAGLVLSVTDGHGATYTVRRDAFGRPRESVDPAGSVTRLEWTADGWLTRRTAPDGSAEQWTYDEEGNCLSHTDPLGGVTRFAYTSFDLLAARTGKDGARYEFGYDTELRLTEVRNPQGRTWRYRYGPSGLTESETDFDGRTTRYEYDAARRLVARTTPLGQRIGFTFDAVGNVVEKDADGMVTRYSYDSGDRLVAAVSPVSSLSVERDTMGRLLAETVDGRSMRFGYDSHGELVSRTTPTGAVSSYAYDTAGNRVRVDCAGHALRFTRDELGRETRRTLGPEQAPVTLASRWDTLGRLSARSLTTARGTLRNRFYEYRADGFLTGVTDRAAGTQWRFELDPVGRPLGVTADDWSERYAYDAIGNQTDAHWPDRARHAESRGPRTYDGTRLLGSDGVRYEYDAAGRVVLRQKRRLSRKPDTWRYTWDAEDRLVSCTTPDGTEWRYTYDALGRRTAKHRMSPDGRTVVSTVRFAWEGTQPAEETDTATGVTLTWEYEGHQPMAQLERRLPADGDQREVDTRFFAIVTDVIGTPTELVGEEGDIAWHKRSTVWGITTRNRDARAHTPLRFPGQYADPETGLHYNLNRHYDPETGRYVSSDPLGLVPAPNPAAYVVNPFTWMDPEGLIAKGCTQIAGWYGGLLPANLMANGKPYPQKMEVNHIPPKAAWKDVIEPGFYIANKPHRKQKVNNGPAIRMEKADHAQLNSTGSSTTAANWHATQRALINQGRITEAMRMDIDDIKTKFPEKYDQHIKEMVESLKHNKPLQDMLAKRGWTIDEAALLA